MGWDDYWRSGGLGDWDWDEERRVVDELSVFYYWLVYYVKYFRECIGYLAGTSQFRNIILFLARFAALLSFDHRIVRSL